MSFYVEGPLESQGLGLCCKFSQLPGFLSLCSFLWVAGSPGLTPSILSRLLP